MDGKVKSKILDILKKENYGLTINEVSNILNIHRVTASKYLAVLEAERKIQVREVGKAKLHYPNGNVKISFGKKSLTKPAGVLLIILISFFVVLMISKVTFASPDTWSSKLLGTIEDDATPEAYFEILDTGDERPSYSGTTTKYAVKLVVSSVAKLDGDEYAYCDHSEDGSTVWGSIGNVLITAQQTEWINSTESSLLAQIDHDGVDQEWVHCNISNIDPADEVTYDVYVYFEYTPTPVDNPPIYAYNGTNVTSGSIVENGTVIKIYANWTDDYGLNYTWYESNETGSWVNSTAQALTNWSNLTIDTSGSNFDKGEVFGARIFANDTSGNENYTVPIWYWTIDADPVIQGNAMVNNTSAVVSSGTVIRWNVTITDDVDVNITFFQNDTTNITATEGSNNEWYVERTCSVSVTENWTAIYVNDSVDQWSSNTSVGLAWECDANAPTVANTVVNDTMVNTSDIICVNHTASDSEGHLDKTWVQITFPNSTVMNITTSNAGVCGSGGDVYGVEVNVGGTTGNLTINTSFANDTTGQVGYQSPFSNLTVNVSTPPNTPPTITSNAFTNNTSAVVGQGIIVQWNVTVTDAETEPSIVFFQNDTTNITASNTSSEYWIVKTCFAGEYTENWTAIYANDTSNQWSSNTSINLAWSCDALAPRVENQSSTGTIEIYNNITYRFNVSDNNLHKVWVNLTAPSVSETNYTATQYGGTGWYLEINATELGNYYFEGFANDTLGQENQTATIITVTSQDTTKPKWSNNVTSPTSPVTYSPGQNYQFNITWTDNFQLNETILEFNGVNYTYSLGELSKSNSEYYKNFTDLSAGNYNYKWYANDTSNNWNYTSQFLYQINTAPTEVNLTLNGTDGDKSYERGEITNLTAVLNVSGKTVYIDANYTGTPNQIASDTDSSVTNFTDTGNLNVSVYNITGCFSGDQNYSSSSHTHYMTVQDTEKPQYSNLNNTSAVYGQDFQANATWTDNYQLDKVLFESNYTGTLQNYTVTTYSGSEYYFTILAENHTADDLVVWKWYANDTSSNWNYTSQFNYTVAKASTEMSLWLNETRGNKAYINNTYANFTAQLSVSGKTINLTSNMTGFGTISNTTSVIFNVTHLKETGVFNMTAYWGGDENYTSDSETWYATVTTQNVQANFTMSPTSIDQEENSTVSGNCTCVGGTCTNSFIEIQADGSVIPNVDGSDLQVNGSSAYSLGTISDGETKSADWNVTGHNAGTYTIRIKCNSTETGDSFSNTQNLQVNDTTKPTWSSNQSNIVTTYSSITLSQFNITWADNVEIDKAFIEGDWSGSSQNYTMLNYSNFYTYNETLPVGTFYWKSYVNDTSNNWNVSDTWYFTITKAPTSTRLFLNGTENDRNYNKSDVANLTATVNITGKNVQLWTDFNGSMQNVSNSPGSTPLTNITDTGNLNLGIYNITAYFAEDQNYTKSSASYQMEVYKRVRFNGTLKNAAGNPVNATIKIYKPDTEEEVTNVSTNATGFYNRTFNSTGLHDVLIEVFNDTIKLLRANLSENALDILALDSVPTGNITIPATRVIHKGISARINLTYENVTVCLNYTLASIQYENTIKIFKCSEWNFTYRSCSATWNNLGGVINTTLNMVCINQTNFSAYAAAEAIECGNDVCESGESCSSCSQDCGSCQAGPSDGGEPSGGGGMVLPSKGVTTAEIEIIVDGYIQMTQGSEKVVNIFVRNIGNNTLNNVFLETKGVEAHWREIWDQNINISTNESAIIRVMFKIPSDTPSKNYSVEVIVKSDEMTEATKLILEVKSKFLLVERFDELSSAIEAQISRFLNIVEMMKEKGIPTSLAEELLAKTESMFASAMEMKELGNYTGAISLLQKTGGFLNYTSSSIETVITTEFERLVFLVELTTAFTFFITIILIYDKRKKIIGALNTVYNLTGNLSKRFLKSLRKKTTIPKVEKPKKVPKIEKIPEVKQPKFKMPRVKLPKIRLPKERIREIKTEIEEAVDAELEDLEKIKMPELPEIEIPEERIREIKVRAGGAVRAGVEKIEKLEMPELPEIEIPKIRLKSLESKKITLKKSKARKDLEKVLKKEMEKMATPEIPEEKKLKEQEIKPQKLKMPEVKVKTPKKIFRKAVRKIKKSGEKLRKVMYDIGQEI